MDRLVAYVRGRESKTIIGTLAPGETLTQDKLDKMTTLPFAPMDKIGKGE